MGIYDSLKRPEPMVFVMARNKQEFDYFATEHRDLLPKRVVYLHDPRQLQGTKGVKIYKFGAWYEHPSAEAIVECAKLYEAAVEYLP